MSWYFTVTSEMREIGLKGNELLIYAVINGYSANGEGCYYGSIGYLSELVGVSYNTAQALLKDLTTRGFIRKEEHIINGVKFCHYQVAKTLYPPQKLVPPSPKIGDNNKIDNKYIPPMYPNGYNPPKGESVPKSPILQKFIDLGCDPATLNDWKAARKGAPITESVLQGMLREAKKAGITLADAVRICAEHSWRGFRADYLHSSSKGQPEKKSNTPLLDVMEKFNRRWEQMENNNKPQGPDYGGCLVV